MSYCTLPDFVLRFGDEAVGLTDRTGAGVPDESVYARAAADADAEIDSYLAARYALSQASVPPRLAAIAADIIRYRLHEGTAPDEVRARYEDARRWLESVAAGRVSPDLPPRLEEPVSHGPLFYAPEPVFTGTENL